MSNQQSDRSRIPVLFADNSAEVTYRTQVGHLLQDCVARTTTALFVAGATNDMTSRVLVGAIGDVMLVAAGFGLRDYLGRYRKR